MDVIENIDYVKCPVCFKNMTTLGQHCKKKHNLSIEEFKKVFPGIILECKNLEEKRIKNGRKNGLLATSFNKITKLQNKENYDLNPIFCSVCLKKLPYEKRNNQFCDNSCSTSYNNKTRVENGWTMPENARQKISEARKNKLDGRHSKLFYNTCHICAKLFVSKKNKRKYCSETCLKIHQSLHGQKQRDHHFNRHFYHKVKYVSKYYGEITLDSTWEITIAKELENNNIKWIKPKPFQWLDDKGKTRNYYPDFYLPDFNVYVEPKNPYLVKKDKHKINYVITTYNINLVLISKEKLLTWSYIKDQINLFGTQWGS